MAVLDASFIVKLLLREECSGGALAALSELASRGEELHAPCTAEAEALNAVWKHLSLLRDIDEARATAALTRLEKLRRILHLHPVHDDAAAAMEIAARLGITIYDALYVALARRLGEPLYTYDRKLAEKAGNLVQVVEPACGRGERLGPENVSD